jgi:hypothetical protein
MLVVDDLWPKLGSRDHFNDFEVKSLGVHLEEIDPGDVMLREQRCGGD